MTYLAETDEKAAQLLAEMERAEFKAKATRDAVFLYATGTVAERTAIAGDSVEYKAAMADYFVTVQEYNTTKNKRTTETLIVDVWRSLNANRRQAA